MFHELIDMKLNFSNILVDFGIPIRIDNERLKISKGKSEVVNRRMTDITMAKKKI